MENKTYTFREWQIMNPKNDITNEISLAIKNHILKMGIPPQILEHSDQLEQVELPEGLQLVTHSVRIPKNILLIGVQDEDNQS